MADYTYHGDGSVTVRPSRGQTGGEGMSSSGTYRTEVAARSAVAAGNTKGAISEVEQKQVQETQKKK